MSTVNFTSETNDGCGTFTYVPTKYPAYTVVCKGVSLSQKAEDYIKAESDAVELEFQTSKPDSSRTSVINSTSLEEVEFYDQVRKGRIRALASGTKFKVVSADFSTAFETAQQQWKQSSSA
jgi:hypothetical protein